MVTMPISVPEMNLKLPPLMVQSVVGCNGSWKL
jgi:hypothetical protein